MVFESSIQKDKIDLAMSGLEKLKQNVASVEAKYHILDGHYSVICDEALIKIHDARSTLKESNTPLINELENGEAPAAQLEIEPQLDIEPEIETVPETNIDNYSKESELNNDSSGILPQQNTPPIDHVAEAIEIGLDKLGDALVYPFDVIARLHEKLTKRKSTG